MRLRFTVVLPLLALAAWALIVGVPAVRTYLQLRPMARAGKNAAVTEGRFHGTIPPQSFLPFAVNAAVVMRSHALTAMNMPGALLEMPVAVALTHPSVWYPEELDEWTGSLLVMPVSALPAWWLVGLGIDGLRGKRRVHWLLALLGAVLCGVFVLMVVGNLLGWTKVEHGPGGWVYAGLGTWAALFAVAPLGAAVQRGRVLRGRRE